MDKGYDSGAIRAYEAKLSYEATLFEVGPRSLSTPDAVYAYMKDVLEVHPMHEAFYVILLNRKKDRLDESDVIPLRAALASGRPVQLIDVREGWERMLGAITPSIHAPMSSIDRADFRSAGLDPAAETVVYCAVGVRSLLALVALRERHGFQSVTSLRGGYRAWIASA